MNELDAKIAKLRGMVLKGYEGKEITASDVLDAFDFDPDQVIAERNKCHLENQLPEIYKQNPSDLSSSEDTFPEDVVKAFVDFQEIHSDFKKCNGLNKKISNVHEILVGMTDKHGRICRYIKHQERNDPKNDWQLELSSSLTGYIVYALMLLKHYGINIEEGMEKELKEATKQHGN